MFTNECDCLANVLAIGFGLVPATGARRMRERYNPTPIDLFFCPDNFFQS